MEAIAPRRSLTAELSWLSHSLLAGSVQPSKPNSFQFSLTGAADRIGLVLEPLFVPFIPSERPDRMKILCFSGPLSGASCRNHSGFPTTTLKTVAAVDRPDF